MKSHPRITHDHGSYCSIAETGLDDEHSFFPFQKKVAEPDRFSSGTMWLNEKQNTATTSNY